MSLAEVLTRVARPPDEVIRYGLGSDHLIEKWFPDRPVVAPIVIVIHGGFWADAYDRAHIRPFCGELAQRGYTVASLEYHRVGHSSGDWPGTFQDVVDGISYLAESDDRLSKPVLVGHSAGGHLALWVASRKDKPAHVPGAGRRFSMTGVVSLAGVTDLAQAYDLDLDRGAVDRLLGGSPVTHPARYALADPTLLLPAKAPSILLHGTADDRVPLDFSVNCAAKATQAGVRCAAITISDCGHFDLIDPESTSFGYVVAAIRSLMPGVAES